MNSLCRLVLGGALLLPWLAGVSQAARSGGELVILQSIGRPIHFNPALASGVAVAAIGTQFFASPLRFDAAWQPRPYLARRWHVSEDGLTVTLELVPNAIFHDGVPITSADVAFSVETVRDYHPFKSMLEPVIRVDTPNALTAVLHLARPHPAILLAMSPALLPILPKHVYGDGQDLPGHPANLRPVGSGPFRFVADEGDKVVLERFDDFFVPGRPYLDRVVFRFEPDKDAVLVGLQRGDAHMTAFFLDVSCLQALSACPHLVVDERGYEGIGPLNGLVFNLRRRPLVDVRVRQAIAHAIDRRFITNYLHRGRSALVPGPIAPGSPFAATDLPQYDYDMGKADTLLNEAGFPRQGRTERFKLTLDHLPTTAEEHRDAAAYIRRQLGLLGITVDVRNSLTFGEWAKRVSNWDFDMTLDVVFNWGDPVIGVHRTYQSSNIRKGVLWANMEGYVNTQVDDLMQQAGAEMNSAKRLRMYHEFQRCIVRDLPILWLSVMTYHTVYNKGLENPPLSIWGTLSPLDDVAWTEPRRPRPPDPPPVLPLPDPHDPGQVGRRAEEIIRDYGAYAALPMLQDPARGLLDVGPSGLHVVGITRAGLVFLDNSGQLRPGTDVSGIPDAAGRRLLERFRDAAVSPAGGLVEGVTVWPHPRNGRCGTMDAWCGASGDDLICVMRWTDNGGARP